jgi:hypothetical protein
VPRVAATLGARLGPHWTADRLVRHVERAQTRPVLSNPDKPLAYLAWLLDVVFDGEEEPPEQARRHVETRRQAVIEQAATAAAAHEQLRAGWDQRAAAEASPASAGRAAARAAARAAHGPAPRPYVPPVADPARLAAAAAELAVHRGVGPAEDDAAAWPATAQPGGGVPYGRKEPGDR